MFSLFFSLTLKAMIPSAGGDADYTPTPEASHYPAMIMVDEGDVDETIAYLESLGVNVLRHRDNILLTYIPVDVLPELESGREEKLPADRRISSRMRKVKGIRHIEVSKPREMTPAMNLARNFNNASYIHEGKNLPSPFDGKGVVVGVCDIGIDTRHPNFMDSEMKECRIKKVVHYEENQGRRTVYDTPESIYEWRSDNTDEWHGTHVTGIAAGSYGDFRSLAPAADIVFTGSQLSDVGLLAGVEDIIDYAREKGMPAVINLSMGNYTGPHDGTSLFARYLDLCADDAIICLSSGNEGGGGQPRSMSFDFTQTASSLEVLPNDWGGTDYTGEAEIWSIDATPFVFNYYWRNDTQYSANKRPYPDIVFEQEHPDYWRISADPSDPDYDETFASLCTEGEIVATGGISQLNGRYYVNLQFRAKSDILHGSQAWGEWWPGIKIKGAPGTHVDIFCAGGSFLRAERNNPAPDNKICVSDLATGFRTVCVGSMNNTDIDEGAEPASGYARGDVSYFSSYGTLTTDGRILPLTVAPGAYVTSSISNAYLEKYPDDIRYTDYSAEINGSPAYWIATTGTSMSCPFVVGAIATWLQAYPMLTPEDVISIITTTNRTEGLPDPTNPRHGMGWFDAYDGMQRVLDLASLNTGRIEADETLIKFDGNSLLTGNPSGRPFSVEIYNTAGMLVERHTVADSVCAISLAHLQPGMYVARHPGGSIKILVRQR